MMPDFSIEDSHLSGMIAGVDEAGRGPWAGPVVAAAVILDRGAVPEGLNDSKKLTEKRRSELYDKICRNAQVGVGLSTVDEIDDINILSASLLAMRRALDTLPDRPACTLIDGNRIPRDLPVPAFPVVKGDARSLSIAAASIIAKVTRDRMMQQLAAEYPGYAWEKNKGYGTSEHRVSLLRHGVTPHHRRSFQPIHNILYQDNFLNP